MEDFVGIILLLTQVTVGITTIQAYLRINKIWKRKHEQEVAASQSIVGMSLLILNCIIWIFYYIWVETDLLSVIDTSLYLFESFVFLLISTGLWVKGKDTSNFWRLVKSALRLERKEANYLIKKFFKPKNAEAIIDILHQLAMIDEDLDDREVELINAFSSEWNISYNPEELNKSRSKSEAYNFIRLRESLDSYLDSEPPKEQAGQLKDMMRAIIDADDEITSEEALISDELLGLIESYIRSDNQNRPDYQVLIVPQNPEHHDLIKNLIPTIIKVETAGGIAYSLGSYYSRKYAEIVSEQYREINLFTIVYVPEKT